jgi:hypothetical protein
MRKNEFSQSYYPKLIVNNHNIEVAYVPNQNKRNQEKKSEYESSFVLMDMPSDIRKATLDDYNGAGRQDALAAALDFIDSYVNKKIMYKDFIWQGILVLGRLIYLVRSPMNCSSMILKRQSCIFRLLQLK